MYRKIAVYAVIAVALLVSGCSTAGEVVVPSVQTDEIEGSEEVLNVANPASVYCQDLGYAEDTRSDDSGQYSVCLFDDGSECETWDFLSGRCGTEYSYCVQQGGTLEEGSNTGTCVFLDGSSCDEYAYFTGDCQPKDIIPANEAAGGGPGGTSSNGGDVADGSMAAGITEEFSDWWGVISSTEPGAQYDDYFERQDLGQSIYFGIESEDPAIQEQIKALRDTGKVVHLWGILLSNVPDYNGSQVRITRIEVGEDTASDGNIAAGATEEFSNWWGVIKSTEAGAQYDDYFERRDLGQIIYFGIESEDPAIQEQIKALRDTGKVVHLWGILINSVPDYNSSQVRVTRIEVEEAGDASSYMPPGATEEFSDWWGVIKSTEAGAQYDDYFERRDLGQIIYFGIESEDPAIQEQIKALRDTGKVVHLWGILLSNVPDYNGSQLRVTRLEVE